MTTHEVVSKDEWVEARKRLLAKEKEFTHLREQLSAERRALPWVRIEKDYTFDGPNGRETLAQLFDDRFDLQSQAARQVGAPARHAHHLEQRATLQPALAELIAAPVGSKRLDLGNGAEVFSYHYEEDLDHPGNFGNLAIRPLLWRDGWPVEPGRFVPGPPYERARL